MKILLSGGGSGGHVTPLKYLAHELKNQDKKHELYFIGPRNDGFAHLMSGDKAVKKSFTIFSGKWRRYSNETLLQKLFDVRTNVLNIRDVAYVAVGIVQSVKILRSLRPDIVLLKGGFVCVPVGIAARILKIPFVTHDSDTIAGLANRIVGKWAHVNAVGQQHGRYPYGADKLRVVGVPINPSYTDYSKHKSANEYKKQLKLSPDLPFVLVMGGSLGAESINSAILESIPSFINNKIQVVNIAGKGKAAILQDAIRQVPEASTYISVLEFENDAAKIMAYYLAADVVVSRAGTTSIAELSALKRAAVIIPASQLSDQVSNAKLLKEKKAAKIVGDSELTESPEKLVEVIVELIKNPEQASRMAANLYSFSNHTATKKLARLLTEVEQG